MENRKYFLGFLGKMVFYKILVRFSGFSLEVLEGIVVKRGEPEAFSNRRPFTYLNTACVVNSRRYICIFQ